MNFRRMVVILAALLFLLPAVASADIVVYVGYADSLRASGFFPNPWCGAASVQLCAVQNAALDSGAWRIHNNGPSPIVIGQGATITLNPGTGPIPFSLWDSSIGAGGFTLNPGMDAIFGQTAQYNFDTSDYGFISIASGGGAIDASHLIGGCTNPSALSAAEQALCNVNQPQIAVAINGTPLNFTDTGHILDTGGYDFVYASADGNESINWNVIGSAPIRGGNEVPEPASIVLVGSGGLALMRRWRKRS